jgi:hypothetical protein
MPWLGALNAIRTGIVYLRENICWTESRTGRRQSSPPPVSASPAPESALLFFPRADRTCSRRSSRFVARSSRACRNAARASALAGVVWPAPPRSPSGVRAPSAFPAFAVRSSRNSMTRLLGSADSVTAPAAPGRCWASHAGSPVVLRLVEVLGPGVVAGRVLLAVGTAGQVRVDVGRGQRASPGVVAVVTLICSPKSSWPLPFGRGQLSRSSVDGGRHSPALPPPSPPPSPPSPPVSPPSPAPFFRPMAERNCSRRSSRFLARSSLASWALALKSARASLMV